jgi:hypothetical protein
MQSAHAPRSLGDAGNNPRQACPDNAVWALKRAWGSATTTDAGTTTTTTTWAVSAAGVVPQ